MPFTNKGDLKTTVQNYCARTDSQFTNQIDNFIALAESRMQYGSEDPFPSPPLRTKSQERTAVLTTDVNGQVSLPADLLEIRAVYKQLNQDGSVSPRLVYIEPMEFYANNVIQVSGGTPINYTITGKQEDAQFSEGLLEVQPTSEDIDLVILYITKIPSLVLDTDSNWILSNNPNCYLSGTLAEAFIYTRNQDLALQQFRLYTAASSGLKTTEERSRRQGAPLAPRFSVA